MESTADARTMVIAGRQAGTFTRAQARSVGMTDRMIDRRLQTGRWVRLHPGVFAVAGAPCGWWRDLWAASLALGPTADVSHETALLVHGVDPSEVPRYPLTFSVPHGARRRARGTVVRQVVDMPAHLTDLVDGLRVSTPPRAIVELAGVVGPRRLDHLVDVVTRRITSVARLSACAAELARPGRPGVAALGAVLDERGPGYVPPHSELEARMMTMLAANGLPAPVRQFPLPGCGAAEGLVDAAYPDVRVILEADGRRWHTRVRDLRRDHEREARAARAGWQTLRFLYEQIVEAPTDVVATVTGVRAVRGAQLARSTG